MLADKTLKEVAQVALRARISWHTRDHHEVSHMKASRLFKFLARYSPNLARISCCFASDRLYGGSLLESSLGCLAGCTPRLTHLTLLNVDVTDVVLQYFARHCPGLTHVAIGRTENNAFGNFVSDEGLAALARGCRQLGSLALFRCYSCSDAGLRELAAQGRQLKSLVLHSCPQVTAAGLVSFFEASPGLLALDVLAPESGPGSGCLSFEACFALAANCSKLKVLRLSEELVSRGVLDDACLAVIGRGCTALQALELVQVEVSDSLMSVLASHCSQLTSLRLEQTYVGDEGVQRILAGCPGLKELRSWCQQLTSLSLDWLKVDGTVLQPHLTATLQQCPKLSKLSLVGYQGSVDELLGSLAATGAALSHLNLQHSQVSDAGLQLAAAAFPKLASIYLCYCRNVGDHGLLQLLALPHLEELDLYNTPCVSAAAVAKLARYCSSLQRLYIGHSTSALHRLPATAPAMGYINGSSSSSRYGSSSSGGSSSSVWGAVNEAANCRRGGKVAVLCHNPSSESEFEKRTLQTLMARR
ncbi:hypothetical protein OEZ86_008140 [Tetradesmus obliquus]|nr:hypothetical protein OEZ86_008140 [Tetradesmus obliquus]